jgi:hypothetical protein
MAQFARTPCALAGCFVGGALQKDNCILSWEMRLTRNIIILESGYEHKRRPF